MHIAIVKPENSGSMYYNYKKLYNIVLLAACDSQYRFVLVDVGAYGSQSDGGVLDNSEFGRRLKDGSLGLPPPEPLDNRLFPYFAVGDAAFPLHRNIMRPYPGHNLTTTQTILIIDSRGPEWLYR